MVDKKELSFEELENVNGGGTGNANIPRPARDFKYPLRYESVYYIRGGGGGPNGNIIEEHPCYIRKRGWAECVALPGMGVEAGVDYVYYIEYKIGAGTPCGHWVRECFIDYKGSWMWNINHARRYTYDWV